MDRASAVSRRLFADIAWSTERVLPATLERCRELGLEVELLPAASDVDIDHIVPLAEAWRSGASSWTQGTREDFANDTKNPQLIAVTDNVNQAKGDKDPAAWKPPLRSYWCTYAKMWVRTKDNYDLTVQSTEKAALTEMLGTC